MEGTDNSSKRYDTYTPRDSVAVRVDLPKRIDGKENPAAGIALNK
jgi:hypothetical protein